MSPLCLVTDVSTVSRPQWIPCQFIWNVPSTVNSLHFLPNTDCKLQNVYQSFSLLFIPISLSSKFKFTQTWLANSNFLPYKLEHCVPTLTLLELNFLWENNFPVSILTMTVTKTLHCNFFSSQHGSAYPYRLFLVRLFELYLTLSLRMLSLFVLNFPAPTIYVN